MLPACLYAWIVRQPPQSEPQEEFAQAFPSFGQALANGDIWLLGATFACFNFVLVSIGIYYPTFLHEVRSYPLPTASFLASIATLVVLFSAPAAGWLSDRLNSRRLLIAVLFLAIAVLLLFHF